MIFTLGLQVGFWQRRKSTVIHKHSMWFDSWNIDKICKMFVHCTMSGHELGVDLSREKKNPSKLDSFWTVVYNEYVCSICFWWLPLLYNEHVPYLHRLRAWKSSKWKWKSASSINMCHIMPATEKTVHTIHVNYQMHNYLISRYCGTSIRIQETDLSSAFRFLFSVVFFLWFFVVVGRLRSFLCKIQSISLTKHINFILQTKEMHKDYTFWLVPTQSKWKIDTGKMVVSMLHLEIDMYLSM